MAATSSRGADVDFDETSTLTEIKIVEEDEEEEAGSTRSQTSIRHVSGKKTISPLKEVEQANNDVPQGPVSRKAPRARAPSGVKGKQYVDEECVSVGPADYVLPSVSLTNTHYPEYSIPNRNIYNPIDDSIPAPNAYALPDMMIMSNRHFTLKKRIMPSKKAIAGPCKVGPTYNVKNFNTGKGSFKYSIPKARRDKVMTGPPNMLLQPEDTVGFKTPGPEAFSEDAVRPHSYHANFTGLPEKKHSDIPGPSHYVLPELDPGLQKSIGTAIIPDFSTDNPAPNEYEIGSRFGDGPAYSITLPVPPIQPFRVPSPCAYMREREYDHKEKVHIAYRYPSPPFDPTPAPPAYKIVGDTDKPKPCPSIKSRNRVPFPSSLWSVDCDVGKSPGPAAHDVPRDIANKDKAASLKKPFVKQYPGKRPGPSDHGRIEVDPLSTKGRAPAFSMRPQYGPVKPRPIPGPAAYETVPLDIGNAVSLKGRHHLMKRHPVPAPNAYNPRQGCTRKGLQESMGFTLSSRHSPWQYCAMKRMA